MPDLLCNICLQLLLKMDFKIDHSLKELKEGQTYIMTIQDSSVLDGDDDDGVLLEDQNL